MIRVVIVDDHPVVRAGLSALISSQSDLEVVGEATNMDEALAKVAALNPDVVLMDLQLGAGPGGAQTTAKLRAQNPKVQVLVLTTFDTEADIVAALDAGARGYLLKDSPASELWEGIRATAKGRTTLATSVQQTLVRRSISGSSLITEREVEVLEKLAQGMGNRQLAKELFVSEATIKSHLSHIYDKLGVSTRAGAVAEALAQRIIRRVN